MRIFYQDIKYIYKYTNINYYLKKKKKKNFCTLFLKENFGEECVTYPVLTLYESGLGNTTLRGLTGLTLFVFSILINYKNKNKNRNKKEKKKKSTLHQ